MLPMGWTVSAGMPVTQYRVAAVAEEPPQGGVPTAEECAGVGGAWAEDAGEEGADEGAVLARCEQVLAL